MNQIGALIDQKKKQMVLKRIRRGRLPIYADSDLLEERKQRFIKLKNERRCRSDDRLRNAIVRKDNEEVQWRVKKGANVNYRSESGGWTITPLMIALRANNIDAMRILLEKGADVDAIDDARWTPLMHAAFFGRVEIAEMLIKKGADVNARDNDWKTPLMKASAMGRVKVAEILIKNGARLDEKNRDGSTALMLAMAKSHQDVVKLLMKHMEKKSDTNE